MVEITVEFLRKDVTHGNYVLSYNSLVIYTTRIIVVSLKKIIAINGDFVSQFKEK